MIMGSVFTGGRSSELLLQSLLCAVLHGSDCMGALPSPQTSPAGLRLLVVVVGLYGNMLGKFRKRGSREGGIHQCLNLVCIEMLEARREIGR